MRVIVAALAIVLVAVHASAQEPSVRLEYSAADGCPDEAQLWARVLARDASATRTDLDGRVFVATIEPTAGGFRGRLRVTEPDGGTTERTIETATCDEAVSAIALVTALAIHPRVPATVEPEPVSSAPAQRADPSVRGVPAAGLRAAPEPPPPVESTEREPLGFAVGGGIDFAPRRGEQPVIGGALSVALRSPTAGPIVRLALSWSPSGTRDGGQRAHFDWWLARVTACPAVVRVEERLFLSGCLTAEGGVLAAAGVDVGDARTAVRPWLAGGAGARFTIGITARVDLELGAAILLAAVRDRFHFADGSTALRAPLVQPVVDAGLAVSIP